MYNNQQRFILILNARKLNNMSQHIVLQPEQLMKLTNVWYPIMWK